VQSFDATLRFHRRRRGLTQEKLAELSAVSVRTIRDLESGRVKSPRAETIMLLAKALKLASGAVKELKDTAAAAAGHARIPVVSSGFFGRDMELSLLLDHLFDYNNRLITLTGLPGVGKTRLAIETLHRLNQRKDLEIVWFPSGPPEGSINQALQGAADQRPVICMVNDIDDAEGKVAWLPDLLASSGVSVVVSARQPLELPGESVLPLAPLSVPETADAQDLDKLAQQPAVQLLVSNIRQLWPMFRLSSASAHPIVKICRQLDGIPVALQAAAAECVVDSPRAVARRAADNPLSLIAVGQAGEKAARLRSGLERALSEVHVGRGAELRALVQLDGYWTISEAAQITGCDASVLGALVRNLIRRGMLRCSNDDGMPRFSTLNVVRSLF
jgi:transcriptional regulator with XRE-family HTH domain